MPRTLVVLSLEPEGAAQLSAVLAASGVLHGTGVQLLQAGDAGPTDLPDAAADAAEGLRLLVSGEQVTAWLAAHRAQPERFDILYLRSTAVLLWDVLIERGMPPDPVMAVRRRFAELLDQALGEFPQLSLEDLYFAPAAVLASLLPRLGLDGRSLPALLPDAAPARSYARSMAALRLLGGPEGEALNTLLDLRLGETRRIGRGQPGSVILGRGWSYLEAKLVWSDGDRATLAVPLPPDAEGPLCCRLMGWVVEDAFTLRASIRGVPVGTSTWAAGAGRAAVVDIPLTLVERSSDRIVPIDLAFEGVVTPDPTGKGDQRRLGIALQSVQVFSARHGPDRDAGAEGVAAALLAAGCRRPSADPTPVPPPSPAEPAPPGTAAARAALGELLGPHRPHLAVLLLGRRGAELAAALPCCDGATVVLAVAEALPVAPSEPRLLLWEGGTAAALQLLGQLSLRADLLVTWDAAPAAELLAQATAAPPPSPIAQSLLLARADHEDAVRQFQTALNGTADVLLAAGRFLLARLGRRGGV